MLKADHASCKDSRRLQEEAYTDNTKAISQQKTASCNHLQDAVIGMVDENLIRRRGGDGSRWGDYF